MRRHARAGGSTIPALNATMQFMMQHIWLPAGSCMVPHPACFMLHTLAWVRCSSALRRYKLASSGLNACRSLTKKGSQKGSRRHGWAPLLPSSHNENSSAGGSMHAAAAPAAAAAVPSAAAVLSAAAEFPCSAGVLGVTVAAAGSNGGDMSEALRAAGWLALGLVVEAVLCTALCWCCGDKIKGLPICL